MLIHNLVSTEPNAILVEIERKHVVDERFAFWVVFWRVENLYQHLFDKSQVCGIFEGFVKGEKRSAVLEAVSS